MHATAFLHRLGLDHAADERAVKRAYARELKQIDQEQDAAGFQMLRHAYEMALDWARRKPAGGDDQGSAGEALSFAPPATPPVPVVVTPQVVPELRIRQRAAPAPQAPARDADTGDSPAELAQAVFDDFHMACAALVAKGRAGDGLAWRRQLQASLDDERLLNIAARAHFEFYVGRLLANGWRSGHESLFPAARQVFGWEKDRRRLDEFGQLGAWLNQAIDECAMFEQQGGADTNAQADAILRLREAAEPGTRDLVLHAPHLRNMAERFPAWTAIIASTERIGEWIAREQALPKWRRARARAAAAGSDSSGDFNWSGLISSIVLIALMLSRCSSHPGAAPSPPFNPQRIEQTRQITIDDALPLTAEQKSAEETYQRAAGALYMKPGTRKLDGSPYAPGPAALPPPPDRAYNDAVFNTIAKRVKYNWSPVPQGVYRIVFDVELDGEGKIVSLEKKTATGLPGLDEKFEKSIRAAAPFGAKMRRRFRMTYEWTMGPKVKAVGWPQRPEMPAPRENAAAAPKDEAPPEDKEPAP